nr:hypothetical protein [Actinoplanes awajinensis]
MSNMHDPRPSAPDWPTTVMPTVASRDDKYAAAGRRRLIVLGSAGAFLAVAIGYWAFSGSDDDTPAPVAAPVTSSVPAPALTTVEPLVETSTKATSKPPTSKPTTKPVATQQVRPGLLLQQMQRELGLLVRRDELERDDARSLSQRLRKVAESLRKNDQEAAARRLKDFAKKLVDLHEDDDISEDGFTALANAAGQLATQLPPL